MRTLIICLFTPTLAAFGLYVWLFACAMLREPTWKHLITLLLQWQTQTGAAFALAAALIGAGVVWHQTQVSRRQEKDRRERRAMALRAVLPLALSELSDYAEACAKILAGAHDRQTRLVPTGPEFFQGALTFPTMPDGLVGQLTELIEATTSDQARPLIILIRRLQIQHARVLDIRARGISDGLEPTEILARMIDAAEIFARCDKLFEYARGDTDAPANPTSATDVWNALQAMIPLGLRDMENDLRLMCDRRAKDGENGSPWPQN